MPIRYDLMQKFSFVMAVVNLAAVLFFLVLLFAVPIFTNLSARSKFADLDRAGVINAQAVQNMPENSGLTLSHDPISYRTAVPDFIASSSSKAQKFASTSGLFICLANTIIWFALWWLQKRASIVIEKIKKQQDADSPEPHKPIDPDADTIDIAT